MNISAWAIRQPIPSIVLFLLLTLSGIASFRVLGVDENPNIDVPIVSVVITQVGAAPSELETQVTKKVEDALAGVNNIKHITSTVNEGSSTTSIEFELGTNTDRAVNDVRDSVTKIRQQLPAQINEPLISRVDFIGGPLATYTISASGHSIEELSWLIDNTISRSLLALGGVGQVQRSGGVQREISVELEPSKIEAVGLTAEQVSNQIRALNIDLPGGRGQVGAEEQSIRTLGSAETVEQLREARISTPMGGWVALSSLGKIGDGTTEPRQAALVDGQPVVAFSVIRSTGSNMVEVADKVDAALDKLRETLPPDIKIQKIRTNAKYVLDSYQASMDSLVIGAVLAVIVIWLFLRDLRAAVISALAMPMSIVPTFMVMKVAGFTLNNMSLLGLALVIGILVDDAIVEIENIVRHIHMGKDPYNASLEAADEIGLAVVATTASIIVVFLPVSFMPGIPGQFFRQFGLTVAIAVFFSLAVARLITPMMAAYWMKEPPSEGSERSWLVRTYDLCLTWCMAYRAPTLLLSVIFFVFSLGLFSLIPTSLIGNADRGELVLSVELPPGSELSETIEASKRLTEILLKHKEEVKKVYATIGSSQSTSARDTSQGQVNKASLYVVLTPRSERKLSQKQFEDLVRPELGVVPGARMSFGMAQGISGKLRVTLASDNAKALTAKANELLVEMRKVPGLSDVNSSAALVRPEILVRPDFAKVAEQGASVQSIARTAQIATLGDIDQNLAKFDLPDRQVNIRVKLAAVYRHSLDSIRNLKIPASGNRLIPLSSVATVELGQGPSQIDRYDRKRQVGIEASLAADLTLGDAIKRVHEQPTLQNLGKEVIERPSGDAEIQKDVFRGFFGAMQAAVVFIYAVLVLLFVGFLHPLTIMVALPLSIGGAIMGLLIGKESLGMYALIGIIMLMGLSTKNSILLVEYCLMSMNAGMSRHDAIFSAGEARMRPILMTTVAMIAGMVPIAMGIGAGSEIRKSMAIAVIGGLLTSTVLTLLVVPVVFTYVDDLQVFLKRSFGQRVDQKEVDL